MTEVIPSPPYSIFSNVVKATSGIPQVACMVYSGS